MDFINNHAAVIYKENASGLCSKGVRFTRLVKSQLVLAPGIEKPAGAVVIRLRHKDPGGAAQIAVIRRGGFHKILHGGDAVLFEHHHEHFGIDDRAGVKQFHANSLTRI